MKRILPILLAVLLLASSASNGTDETAHFQRAVLNNSRNTCLLMPGTKVGTDAFVKVTDAADFNTLITDWECLPEQVAALRELGLEVVTVSAPPTLSSEVAP